MAVSPDGVTWFGLGLVFPDEFRGADLIALREMEFADDQAVLAAKRLLRLALSAYLGDKPLHSRGLFAVST